MLIGRKIRVIENYFSPIIHRWMTAGNIWKPKNKYFELNYEESMYGSSPRTKSGGNYMVTVVEGVNNPHVWESVYEVLHCAGAPIELEMISLNDPQDAEDKLENLILSIQRNGIAVKGDIESRKRDLKSSVFISRNMLLRKTLDLFIRVNWIKSMKPLRNLRKVHEELDIVLIRQNTEGEFSLLEYSPLPEMVEHIDVVTRYNCRRIADYTFKYAAANKRKKVSLIIKERTAPKAEDSLFNEFVEVSKLYPDITFEGMKMTLFMKSIQRKDSPIDVLVCTSLTGSIILSVIQGYLGSSYLIPSFNASEKYQVWETAYYPSNAQDVAQMSNDNPISHILIFLGILKTLGKETVANAISDSLFETLQEGVKTEDLGGTATPKEFCRFMVSCLKRKIAGVQCSFDPTPALPPTPPPTKAFEPSFMPGMVPPNPNYKENMPPPPDPGSDANKKD